MRTARAIAVAGGVLGVAVAGIPVTALAQPAPERGALSLRIPSPQLVPDVARPVPMPHVLARGPRPVPMPRVEPHGPAPVPMPRLQPTYDQLVPRPGPRPLPQFPEVPSLPQLSLPR